MKKHIFFEKSRKLILLLLLGFQYIVTIEILFFDILLIFGTDVNAASIGVRKNTTQSGLISKKFDESSIKMASTNYSLNFTTAHNHIRIQSKLFQSNSSINTAVTTNSFVKKLNSTSRNIKSQHYRKRTLKWNNNLTVVGSNNNSRSKNCNEDDDGSKNYRNTGNKIEKYYDSKFISSNNLQRNVSKFVHLKNILVSNKRNNTKAIQQKDILLEASQRHFDDNVSYNKDDEYDRTDGFYDISKRRHQRNVNDTEIITNDDDMNEMQKGEYEEQEAIVVTIKYEEDNDQDTEISSRVDEYENILKKELQDENKNSKKYVTNDSIDFITSPKAEKVMQNNYNSYSTSLVQNEKITDNSIRKNSWKTIEHNNDSDDDDYNDDEISTVYDDRNMNFYDNSSLVATTPKIIDTQLKNVNRFSNTHEEDYNEYIEDDENNDKNPSSSKSYQPLQDISYLNTFENLWNIFVAANKAWNIIAETNELKQQQIQNDSTTPKTQYQEINQKLDLKRDFLIKSQQSHHSFYQNENNDKDRLYKRESSIENFEGISNKIFKTNMTTASKVEKDKTKKTTETSSGIVEGRYIKGDPLKGYYDFVITEGSYKFWACFQLATAVLIIYSTFAAIYYSKVNPLVGDYDYVDYLGGARSLSSSSGTTNDYDMDFIELPSSSLDVEHNINSKEVKAMNKGKGQLSLMSSTGLSNNNDINSSRSNGLLSSPSSFLSSLLHSNWIQKLGYTGNFIIDWIDKIKKS